jgi:hypothetical protein
MCRSCTWPPPAPHPRLPPNPRLPPHPRAGDVLFLRLAAAPDVEYAACMVAADGARALLEVSGAWWAQLS